VTRCGRTARDSVAFAGQTEYWPLAPKICARGGAQVKGSFCVRDGVLATERFVVGDRYVID
jgi:hypothetical protein